jgi:hypothetical protein
MFCSLRVFQLQYSENTSYLSYAYYMSCPSYPSLCNYPIIYDVEYERILISGSCYFLLGQNILFSIQLYKCHTYVKIIMETSQSGARRCDGFAWNTLWNTSHSLAPPCIIELINLLSDPKYFNLPITVRCNHVISTPASYVGCSKQKCGLGGLLHYLRFLVFILSSSRQTPQS